MFTLEVRNFGVLKDIKIELNKTNLFIGENGSGKSVLAKLITIVTSFDKYADKFLEEFSKLDIDFIQNNTVIKLTDHSDIFIIENKKVIFSKEVLETISSYDKTHEIVTSFANPHNIPIDDILPRKYISRYVPAERNLISIFNSYISNFFSAQIPLPDALLLFSSEYNKAKKEIKSLNLLNIKYSNQNGQDRIYYDDENYLPLEHSSSGIQSALPMYLTLKYFSLSPSHIIIEEPEQNLYPKAQMDTIKYIIETTNNNDTYLMTHSPYILSTLNILLFAYKASNTNDILKEKISEIIPESQQINPDEFSAYLIEDGVSKSIKGESTGMIMENVIDDVGDIIDDEFEELMETYREFKNV